MARLVDFDEGLLSQVIGHLTIPHEAVEIGKDHRMVAFEETANDILRHDACHAACPPGACVDGAEFVHLVPLLVVRKAPFSSSMTTQNPEWSQASGLFGQNGSAVVPNRLKTTLHLLR